MTTITAIVTNGLVAGAIYGLVAVGLALVYKKSAVLNFANAEAGMLGAFLFYALSVEQGWPYVVAALVGVLSAAGLGATTYLVLAPRRDDQLTMLIGTLAVGAILIFIAVEVWGTNPHFLPPPLADLQVDALGFHLSGARILVLCAAVVIGAVSFLVFRYTDAGLVFRASAGDAYVAQLMGVNVVFVDVVTWAIAGALAGVAAILIAPLVGFHVFFMSLLAVRGFAAALLAGMTGLGGSIAAGLGLGLGESVVTWAIPSPGVPEAVMVAVIVITLTIRPISLGRRTA